jgi:hypothetical protein
MSVQTPCATPLKPGIREHIANAATPVRRELIRIAAFDLHRAASSYNPRDTGSRAVGWYVPPFAVLQILR